MLTGIILGGGRSERLGKDKVFLPWEGGTILDYQIQKLRPFCRELILVTNRPQAVPPVAELKVVTDDIPYQGPLGGIVAGLKASVSESNLVIAVDMPFVNEKIIGLLIDEAKDFDVVIPESERGLEVLQAVYAQSCLEPAERHLNQGDRRIVSFFGEVRVKVISKEIIGQNDPKYISFFNINSRRDYEKALSILEEVKA